MWDADRYLRFERERARPFHDLLREVEHPRPKRVVDLGCGPGGLTASLAVRWNHAFVVGVDSSVAMLARARRRAVAGRLSFVLADLARWRPGGSVDVVVSNSCFHWIPDHHRLLAELVGWLSSNGVLAFQVPDNFDAPSHRIARDTLHEEPWATLLPSRRPAAVESPEWYVRELSGHGLEVDAWTTTYLHVLAGADPVLRWLEGTTLRPALDRLAPAHRDELLETLRPRLAEAYPVEDFGTLFPFRRSFVIARRRQ